MKDLKVSSSLIAFACKELVDSLLDMVGLSRMFIGGILYFLRTLALLISEVEIMASLASLSDIFFTTSLSGSAGLADVFEGVLGVTSTLLGSGFS